MATVRSKGVVLFFADLLCIVAAVVSGGFCVCSLCCCAVFGVLSSLASHG